MNKKEKELIEKIGIKEFKKTEKIFKNLDKLIKEIRKFKGKKTPMVMTSINMLFLELSQLEAVGMCEAFKIDLLSGKIYERQIVADMHIKQAQENEKKQDYVG